MLHNVNLVIKNKFSFIVFFCIITLVAGLAITAQKNQPQTTAPFVQKKVLGSKNVATISMTPISTDTPTIAAHFQQHRIGIVVDDYTNSSSVTTLQQQLGITFSTISIYKQFGMTTNNMITPSDLSYIKAQGSRLLIAWEPWNPNEGMNQSTDYLKEIENGQEDSYIKNFADEVKQYGSPVTIRFGHEMNGNWYPWGQRPAEYVNAYRRVVELFRNERVTNVSWMWSVNASPLNYLSSYYPGNDYVDSIGIDGFNYGTTQANSTWVTFAQIFQPAYNLLSQTYNKPLIISETSSSEVGGNKADWIRNMFLSASKNMPKIQEIIWFDLNKETDWRIDSSTTSWNAFKQVL